MINVGIVMMNVKNMCHSKTRCSRRCMQCTRSSRVGGRWIDTLYDVGSTDTIVEVIERMVKSGGDGMYETSITGSKWFNNGLIIATLGWNSFKAAIILAGQCWQYIPSIRRDNFRRPVFMALFVDVNGMRGSILTTSTSKPQSSMVLVTEPTRSLRAIVTVAELFKRLTTTSETPGSCETTSVMVPEQEEHVIPPTDRVTRCATSPLWRPHSRSCSVSQYTGGTLLEYEQPTVLPCRSGETVSLSKVAAS